MSGKQKEEGILMNVTVLEALRNALFRVGLETGQDTTRRHSDRRAVAIRSDSWSHHSS